MLTGIELIADERQEQLQDHGRTVELDVKNNSWGQLRQAAIGLLENGSDVRLLELPLGWEYTSWERMVDKSEKERLIIAGALIAAEIDKIQNQ